MPAYAEPVRIAVAKIEIALGLDVNTGEFSNRPRVDRGLAILRDLTDQLAEDVNRWPLALLAIPEDTLVILESAGIAEVWQLREMTGQDLLGLYRISHHRIAEIDAALAEAGIPRRLKP
jgi:hypothetical protein